MSCCLSCWHNSRCQEIWRTRTLLNVQTAEDIIRKTKEGVFAQNRREAIQSSSSKARWSMHCADYQSHVFLLSMCDLIKHLPNSSQIRIFSPLVMSTFKLISSKEHNQNHLISNFLASLVPLLSASNSCCTAPTTQYNTAEQYQPLASWHWGTGQWY